MIFFLKQTCHSQTGGGGGGVPHLGKIPTFSRFFFWGASLRWNTKHHYNTYAGAEDRCQGENILLKVGGISALTGGAVYYVPIMELSI